MRAGILRCLLLAAALVAGEGLVSATTFSFTASNYGPAVDSIPTSTQSGLSVTATGYWANVNNSGATVTGTSNDFASTWVAEYSGAGIGVCNPNEQPSCASPQHQIDNLNGLEFVNFAFSQSVSFGDVFVQGYGNPTGVNGSYNDVDLSYAILSMAQEMSLISGTLSFNSVTFTTYNTNFYGYNDYTLPGAGQYILIGAAVTPYYGDVSASQATPDAFKIQTLTVTATPEPASLVLIGSGLLVAFFLHRRAKRNLNPQPALVKF